jgi:hypothetical protein
MRKTNPIWPCRGRLTEEIVRNEAKLRWTGVYGQRQLSCGPWLGRGVKRAKRTQFRGPEAHDCELVTADWRTPAVGVQAGQSPVLPNIPSSHPPSPQPRPERKRAKRTQFGPGRRRLTDEIVQNEAKRGETGVCGKRQLSCGAWLGRRPDAQNEANLRRVSGLKSQVSSRRSRTRHALTSNCTFPTSNFLGNALRRHYEWGIRAKRTQFAGRAERRCFPGSATQSSIILHQSSIAQNWLWRAGVECGRIAR